MYTIAQDGNLILKQESKVAELLLFSYCANVCNCLLHLLLCRMFPVTN